MHRTTLMIDPRLLAEASKVLTTKTQSETVNRALSEAIRVAKIRGLADLFGSGIWDGDLNEMRRDQTARKKK